MEISFAIVAIRALHLAALSSTLGVLVFRLWVAPAAWHDTPAMQDARMAPAKRPLDVLMHVSAAVALVGALCWWPIQAADMVGAGDPDTLLMFLPVVLTQTHFGVALMWRCGLLMLGWMLFGYRPGSMRWQAGATCLIALACLLQVQMGHGAAVDTLLLPVALGCHVLAGAIWLGGLAPLLLTVACAPQRAGVLLQRFSPLGLGCVTVLALTASVQGWALIGGWHALLTTRYGQVAMVKIALFVALLAVASLNRWWWLPQLTRRSVSHVPRRLCFTLMLESTLGMAIYAFASTLATLSPAQAP